MTYIESPLVSVLRGRPPIRRPIWLMRQAGRYLPEFTTLLEKHGTGQLIDSPLLSCEVALQPVNRFDLDGAVPYFHAAVLLRGIGARVTFPTPDLVQVEPSLVDSAELQALRVGSVEGAIRSLLESIGFIRAKSSVPVIGFAATPWSLAVYLSGDEDLQLALTAKQIASRSLQAWGDGMNTLTQLVTESLLLQVQAGAQVVHLFDTWSMALSPLQFELWSLPWIRRIVERVRARTGVPVIYTGASSAGLFPQLSAIGADCYGVDWRMDLQDASRIVGPHTALQGNLDPSVLLLEQQVFEREVERVLFSARAVPRHIFNVGNSLHQTTDPNRVAQLVAMVHAAPVL